MSDKSMPEPPDGTKWEVILGRPGRGGVYSPTVLLSPAWNGAAKMVDEWGEMTFQITAWSAHPHEIVSAAQQLLENMESIKQRHRDFKEKRAELAVTLGCGVS